VSRRFSYWAVLGALACTAATGAFLARDSTAHEAGDCTISQGLPTSSSTPSWIRFINETTGTVVVEAVEAGGPEQDAVGNPLKFARWLKPGEGYLQQTFLTHPFEVFDETGACIGYVLPTDPPQDYLITGPGDESVSVTLLEPNGSQMGTVRFWEPADAKTPGARVDSSFAKDDAAARNAAADELVLRAGTCRHPAPGRGYNITTEGPNPGSFQVDQLQKSTWSVDAYDTDWVDHHRSSPRVACGDYLGLAPLATSTRTVKPTPVTRRTQKAGTIVVHVRGGSITLVSRHGGARTELDALYFPAGGSTDMLGRIRRGTCAQLTATPDLPVRMPGDEVDTGGPQGGSTVLPIPFSTFNSQHYVFELGAGPDFYGDYINVCIPLWPTQTPS